MRYCKFPGSVVEPIVEGGHFATVELCALVSSLIVDFWIEIFAYFFKLDIYVVIELRRSRGDARSVGPGLGARLHLGPIATAGT